MTRTGVGLATLLALLAPAASHAQEPGAPRETPRSLALVRGACASRIDATVLAGHVALEAPVEIASSGDATLVARWAEAPCADGRVRVSLRDAEGGVLAGPVDLSTEGLSARLEARVVALWIGEALTSLPATRSTSPPASDAAQPAPPPTSPAGDAAREPQETVVAQPATALDASRPTSAAPPVAAPAVRTARATAPVHARIAALGVLGYAPSTTTSIAGGMLALTLRLAALDVLAVQVDVGETVAWTAFGADLAVSTGGLALLVPVALTGALSLELGARVSLSYDALLRANAGVTSVGDQLVGGGGALVRAVLRDGAFGSLVELEVGGPFTGLAVRVADPTGRPPPTDTIILDGMRADVRVGVTFE